MCIYMSERKNGKKKTENGKKRKDGKKKQKIQLCTSAAIPVRRIPSQIYTNEHIAQHTPCHATRTRIPFLKYIVCGRRDSLTLRTL